MFTDRTGAERRERQSLARTSQITSECTLAKPTSGQGPRAMDMDRDCSAMLTAGLPASAGSDERTRQFQPVRSRAIGTKAFDRKPERGKAQGGNGPGVTRVVTPAARTARGDEAQEPRPVCLRTGSL